MVVTFSRAKPPTNPPDNSAPPEPLVKNSSIRRNYIFLSEEEWALNPNDHKKLELQNIVNPCLNLGTVYAEMGVTKPKDPGVRRQSHLRT